MNARLIARGFLNGITVNGDSYFLRVAVRSGDEYLAFSAVCDKALKAFIDNLALKSGWGIQGVIEFFKSRPVVLCIVNPKAGVNNGNIIYTGVLKGFCDYALYKQGMADEKLFGVVSNEIE